MPAETERHGFLDEIQAVILTEEGPIPIAEFAEFFELFRTAYAAALESLVSTGGVREGEFAGDTKRLAQLTRDHLSNLSGREISRLTVRPLPVEPSILRIHRDNPIELVLAGLAILFGVAVVISGGTFEMSEKGLKVELPPLGTGIKNLREAFKRSGGRG